MASAKRGVRGGLSERLEADEGVRERVRAGGAPDLIAIPTDLAKLPAAAGSVAFPDAFGGVTMASPPEEGAVK